MGERTGTQTVEVDGRGLVCCVETARSQTDGSKQDETKTRPQPRRNTLTRQTMPSLVHHLLLFVHSRTGLCFLRGPEEAALNDVNKIIARRRTLRCYSGRRRDSARREAKEVLVREVTVDRRTVKVKSRGGERGREVREWGLGGLGKGRKQTTA